MMKRSKPLAFAAAIALTIAAYAAQVQHQLSEGGNTISTGLINYRGHYMVPVEDIAKYLGYRVTVSGGNVTLTKNADSSVPGAPVLSPLPDALATPPVPPANLPGVMPTTTVPGTALTTATTNLFPTVNQAPAAISSTFGQSATFGDLDYRISSVQDVGTGYRSHYDQRGTSYHPRWKTDTLEVVEMSVTNRGTQALSIYTPGAGDVTLFDSQKIGYPATLTDMRQSPMVDDSSTSSTDYGSYGSGWGLMLGPGGTLHYAVLASLPKGDSVTSVIVNVPSGASGSSSSSGAVLTFSAH